MELERARQGELQRDKKSVNSAGITWSWRGKDRANYRETRKA